MKDKERLAQKAALYNRLKNLTQQSGWEDINNILLEEYSEALDVIKNPKTTKSEVESRAVIKFIERFIDTVNSDLEFGKLAKEQYTKKYFNKPTED